MSDFAADILRALRVFGPLSNADVARRLRVPMHRTYRELYRLVGAGYANHLKLQEWDITAKGRLWFAEQPNRPLSLFEESAP